MTVTATDFSQFSSLRAGADNKDPAVLREVASQFEALFVQTLLKNMRDSSLAEPAFGQSDQHRMYQDMQDQQLALEMSRGKGIGLAEMLVRQLGGEAGPPAPRSDRFELNGLRRAKSVPATANWSEPAAFARELWPHAERAANRLNVAPEAVLAQAALETGWGANVMQRGNGGSSFNLFGIKAGRNWPGDSVASRTTEYSDGIVQRKVERFRSYPDIAATFDDYASLIADNPRYAGVRNHGENSAGFATALQEAGYATDPRYAQKIRSVLESPTMRSIVRELKSGEMLPITEERTPGAHQ